MKVAERCRAALRESDTISRQGGDEFVIVLPGLVHPRDAGHTAEKILAALQRPFPLGQHMLTVTGSIGIALHPEDGENASTLLRNADAAMFRAKANGRNGYAFYAKDMTSDTLGTLLLENQLRGVIDRDELELSYQPKFSAASGQLTGVEAGWAWTGERASLTATVFWNEIKDAIVNVTTGVGPGVFPRAGFVPAGGVLRQRMNAGTIGATGLEIDGRFEVSEHR